MLTEAERGPKGRTPRRGEPSAEAIKYLSATLNTRHAFFFAVQQDRGRKDRRDRAKVLIDELQPLLIEIAAEAPKLNADEFFARRTERAAKGLCAFITSDIIEAALPPVDLPDNIHGWQWCAGSLFEDIRPLVGNNAAMRFLTAVIPHLSGERPSLPSVKARLKQKQVG
ncbi:MAG: hypothetical protein ACLPKT_05450 [Methylocella sp.]